MESKIPLPTDNIFKFYALFGLAVMLTTAIMFFIRYEEYNRRAFERHAPIKILSAKKELKQQEREELFVLEQKDKIDRSNKSLELQIYMFLFFVPGVLATVYGFWQWHTKIQPKQDEYFDLQLEKLRREVGDYNDQ